MRLRVLLTAAALAALPAVVQAATTAERQAMLQACGPDIQTYCSGVQPGGGRVAQCLKPHLQQLSPDCKGQLVSAHARHKQEQQQQQPQPQPQ